MSAKAAAFADIGLQQLGKGKLGLLDIGIMSTMAQMLIEDLALKTRRDLRGKFERVQSAGGKSYGYAPASDKTVWFKKVTSILTTMKPPSCAASSQKTPPECHP
jgi:hypothetical protein